MPKKRLQFTVKLEGKAGSSVAWLNAPFDVPETLGTRARVPVCGTINGFPFRSSLMPMGGCHGMAVNKAMRAGAKAKAGDVVEVVMERDDQARTVEVPPELKKELAKNKKAQTNWEKLSFTNKKEMAISIREAKQEQTRARRLAKVMQILKTGAKWTG
ncbi:MAG: YdeI/OmpD-associated family protein [Acidobacteriia bacterium]|nr:YdeI/OmpD-associated family protein [Terriglobia bacterium]